MRTAPVANLEGGDHAQSGVGQTTHADAHSLPVSGTTTHEGHYGQGA